MGGRDAEKMSLKKGPEEKAGNQTEKEEKIPILLVHDLSTSWGRLLDADRGRSLKRKKGRPCAREMDSSGGRWPGRGEIRLRQTSQDHNAKPTKRTLGEGGLPSPERRSKEKKAACVWTVGR